MEDWRAKHREAAQRPFTPKAGCAWLSHAEYEYLCRHGSWLEALWNGTLNPMTDAQRQFVRAVRDRIECRTFAEVLFRRYLLGSHMQSFKHGARPSPIALERTQEVDEYDLEDRTRNGWDPVLESTRGDERTYDEDGEVVDFDESGELIDDQSMSPLDLSPFDIDEYLRDSGDLSYDPVEEAEEPDLDED